MSTMPAYHYQAIWSDPDQEYVGLCAEFPSLSWVADTEAAALEGIRRCVKDVVQDLEARGQVPPKPARQGMDAFE